MGFQGSLYEKHRIINAIGPTLLNDKAINLLLHYSVGVLHHDFLIWGGGASQWLLYVWTFLRITRLDCVALLSSGINRSAVTAYFSSKQLLPIRFAEHYRAR